MPNYKSLVEQTIKGSTESAYALYLASLKQVYYSALKKTNNDVRTKYVVRDAYIQSIKNIDRLEFPEQYPVWIQSLSNIATDFYLKNRKGYLRLEIGGVNDGPWDQNECDEFSVGEAFAKDLWREIVLGINGGMLEPALPENSRPDGRASQLDDAQIEGILAKMSILKATVKKRAVIICAAIVVAFAVITGLVTYNYNQKHRDRRLSTLSEVYASPEEEKVNAIAKAISSELAGEIGEIYAMSDNTYYVMIYVNDRAAGGALVSYVETNEGDSYKLLSQTDNALTDEEIQALAQDQYLRVNYSSSPEGENALEAAVNKAGETELDAIDNSVSINKNGLGSAVASAISERDKLSEIFDIKEDINVMLSVKCRHVDLTKPVKITIDKSVEEMIGNAGYLRIVLNDNRHCLKFSSQQIKQLCGQYGSVSVKLQAENNKIYNISFWGPDGLESEKLFGDVIFVLPSDSENAYVCASYSGGKTYAEGSENRGGTYDAVEGTISFPVSHSGRYEIIGSTTALFDVGELDDETRRACEFVASLNFIPEKEKGNFKPYKDMTRGEFIEALGKMFFTTDKTQEAGFNDIGSNDELYAYIAAGHAENIVLGVEGDNFKADQIITVEELLTMAGKTMVLKDEGKTVSSINDAAVKFSIPLIFADSKDLSWFSVDPVKTLILFNILPIEGRLQPQSPASRSYAALILHRMYKQVYQ